MIAPRRFLLFALALLLAESLAAQELPSFDFTDPGAASQWRDAHHISALRPTADGLEITISGYDPYFHGPAADYPSNTPLWVLAKLKSDQAGMAEIFYFKEHAAAGQSVKFHVPGGKWSEVRVAMPSLGPGYRLRFDPPGAAGKVLLASLHFEKRVLLPEPEFGPWLSPAPGEDERIRSGDLTLHTSRQTPLAVEFRVRGQSMAFTHPAPLLAYLHGNEVVWVTFSQPIVAARRGRLRVRATATDPQGADWTLTHEYRAGKSGSIDASATLSVNQERRVVFLPMHLLFAGERSFGSDKNQALFAGLEYLENEPSSSEADITGPESRRRTPSFHKITFPLMALQASQRYLGLIWDDHPRFTPMFDSPDRAFNSGGHAMGLLYPGSEAVREEGNLLPYHGALLKAREPLVSRVTIIGGIGDSVVPAVQQYVRLRGLPKTPDSQLSLQRYLSLSTHGWLQSKIREKNLYRHAFWPGFDPMPAADAAVFQVWLSSATRDTRQSANLVEAARGAISAVSARNYYHSGIGHVRMPLAPLLFGSVPEAIEAAKAAARAQLARFDADGAVRYQPRQGGLDYGRTHFAPDANGLTAQAAATLLEAALFSGDRELINQALAKLSGLEKFRNTVPRGAQTWEVPLHTPDILASAHLAKVFSMAFKVTQRLEFLEEARYWAWTGVSFVYLHNATEGPVGPYSTIAVLGATSWKEPVWFGRPVQWCGLVYAHALYELAELDPKGPWRQLADSITAAGLQHTWREDDPERVGLLPDFFELREQVRAGPAINPATLGVNAARFYRLGPMHDFAALTNLPLLVHAPGKITIHHDTPSRAILSIAAWPNSPYAILLTGLSQKPRALLNGAPTDVQFHLDTHSAIISAQSPARLEIIP